MVGDNKPPGSGNAGSPRAELVTLSTESQLPLAAGACGVGLGKATNPSKFSKVMLYWSSTHPIGEVGDLLATGLWGWPQAQHPPWKDKICGSPSHSLRAQEEEDDDTAQDMGPADR